MMTNIQNNFGKITKDTTRVVDLAQKIKDVICDRFIIVGHSKRGYDAAVAAGSAKNQAYIFNPQGIYPKVAKHFRTSIAEINHDIRPEPD